MFSAAQVGLPLKLSKIISFFEKGSGAIEDCKSPTPFILCSSNEFGIVGMQPSRFLQKQNQIYLAYFS